MLDSDFIANQYYLCLPTCKFVLYMSQLFLFDSPNSEPTSAQFSLSSKTLDLQSREDTPQERTHVILGIK